MASQSMVLKPTSQNNRKTWGRRRASMELPERFRISEDENEEDAAKLDDKNNPAAFIQQSVLGLMKAARTKTSIYQGLKPESESDSETEAEGSRRGSKEISRIVNEDSNGDSKADERAKANTTPAASGGHRKDKKAESGSLRPALNPIREQSDLQPHDPMTHSQFLPPKEAVAEETEPPKSTIQHDGATTDQKLQPDATPDMELSRSSLAATQTQDATSVVKSRRKAQQALPDALAEIFKFDEPEDVIAEYACYYLQSVLIQGHMYITPKHVCFFAYLQKKGSLTKSGYVSKQGKRNPHFRRYWLQLRGDVLSYYPSSTDLYFPRGSIDLRYAKSADVAPDSKQDKNKDLASFKITTEARTYVFRADSATSAKEWVKQLQKIIFRSRNDGDSVKIALPLENILDVEPTSILDSANTVKIRAVGNDDSYAVDEYFFTFFNQGQDAVDVLSQMTQDNRAKDTGIEVPESQASVRPQSYISSRPPLADNSSAMVEATQASSTSTTPRLSSERARFKGEVVSPKSFDHARASIDSPKQSRGTTTEAHPRSAQQSPVSPSAQDSTDSSFHPDDFNDTSSLDMSASQVLSGDGVFGAPTLKTPQSKRSVSGSTIDPGRGESRETSPYSSDAERVGTRTPARTQATNMPSRALKAETKSRPTYAQASAPGPTRAVATSLQRAYNLADTVREQGKRMGSYLSSSPKSYYDRFSGAIAGGKRHYSEPGDLAPEERVVETKKSLDAEDERRFQEHFSLPATEKLRDAYYCWLHRVLPLYGKVYISDRYFCFRSLLYGTRTKLVVPYKDIENIRKEKLRFGYPGLVLVIRGHEELFFDFGSQDFRDDCVVTSIQKLEDSKALLQSTVLTDDEKAGALAAAAENQLLEGAREEQDRGKHTRHQSGGVAPMIFDDPSASILDFKPNTSLRITCLTIGSRGDVQPYIALCKGLKEHGHQVKIATHTQFESWIRKHGIDFAPVEGDPAELMRICVENGMFTPSFVMETHTLLRGWMDRLLTSSWKACQNSDLLIESPSAMAGIHVAEALGIPYFRAFGMPWTRTRAYPHAFSFSGVKMSGQWNYLSYILFDNFFWQFSAGHINRWRRKTLNLPPTDLGKLQPNKVPFLYNFSPTVVPPPLDFSDWIRVTGYWFLDEGGEEWTPPEDLLAFIKKAREDKMKLVYIGFGSVPVSDSQQLTQNIVDAVLKADVRCIFSKGWSDHFDKDDGKPAELPPAVFQIRSAPHDWLFQQIDAAVHHGGCGTTGASLRAGIPTVVKPFFGDQFFFGSRVEDLGVGIYVRKITVNELGKAIWLATHDERMRRKARAMGEQIRKENGVDAAINALYRDLEYATTLIKKRGSEQTANAKGEDETEESWTFVENDSEGDVDITGVRRSSDSDWYTQGDTLPRLAGSAVLRGRS